MLPSLTFLPPLVDSQTTPTLSFACMRVSTMASQVIGSIAETQIEVMEIRSYIRGYHSYMGIWDSVQGQMLLVKREPTNPKDKNAVYLDDVIVGYIPHNLVPQLSQFLQRDVNKAFVEVTGCRVNRGAGYGLGASDCTIHSFSDTCLTKDFGSLMLFK